MNNENNNMNNQNIGQNVGINTNNLVNPATQQFQQNNNLVQNSLNVGQAYQQYNNQVNNANLNNKKIKDIKYYRKSININMITLLIISVVAMIFGIFTGGDGVGLFVRCLTYLIPIILLLINYKEIKKFIGYFSIAISIYIIIYSILGLSLFDIVFLILAIFNIVYSAKYLKHLKLENQKGLYIEEKVRFNAYKIISLILIIILPLIAIILNIFTTLRTFTICLPISLISLVLCIVSHIQNKKDTLLYILFSISIILSLLFGQ